jgi:hypothetical protein
LQLCNARAHGQWHELQQNAHETLHHEDSDMSCRQPGMQHCCDHKQCNPTIPSAREALPIQHGVRTSPVGHLCSHAVLIAGLAATEPVVECPAVAFRLHAPLTCCCLRVVGHLWRPRLGWRLCKQMDISMWHYACGDVYTLTHAREVQ